MSNTSKIIWSSVIDYASSSGWPVPLLLKSYDTLLKSRLKKAFRSPQKDKHE